MNIAQYLLRILLQLVLTSFRYIYIFLSSPVFIMKGSGEDKEFGFS